MNCCQSPVTISMWNNFINKKGRSLKERKVFPVRKNKHTKNRACGGWNFSLCLTHSGECPYSNFFSISQFLNGNFHSLLKYYFSYFSFCATTICQENMPRCYLTLLFPLIYHHQFGNSYLHNKMMLMEKCGGMFFEIIKK